MKKVLNERTVWLSIRNIILAIGIILIATPLYLVLINSFKSLEEAGRNFFAFPESFYLYNISRLFGDSEYWLFLKNSTIITTLSIFCVLLLVPSVSYAIARNRHKKYYKFLNYYLIMGLFIPAQVIMLPVTQMMARLEMQNIFGLVLLYATFSLTQGVFLFTNYMRSLPYEIEEAAKIDGCSIFQTYTKIVLHLCKPMIATVVVMNSLWFWNDFMLPLILLNRAKDSWTLPLFQYNFRTEYSFDYPMAFTAYLMSMIPVLIIYCLGQKYIIKGLTAGAIKA